MFSVGMIRSSNYYLELTEADKSLYQSHMIQNGRPSFTLVTEILLAEVSSISTLPSLEQVSVLAEHIVFFPSPLDALVPAESAVEGMEVA